MRPILHTVDIHAPVGKVYRAISTQDGLSNWWTSDVKADAAAGGKAAFNFEGAGFWATMKIAELNENKKVVWDCLDSVDYWLGSKFSFDLTKSGEGTQLLFRQQYAEKANLPEEEYGRFNFNWGYYLYSLKEYCETGRGKPYSS